MTQAKRDGGPAFPNSISPEGPFGGIWIGVGLIAMNNGGAAMFAAIFAFFATMAVTY